MVEQRSINHFVKDLKLKLHKNYADMTRRLVFDDKRQNNKSKNKLRTYCSLKNDHTQEKYLSEITNLRIRWSVIKL